MPAQLLHIASFIGNIGDNASHMGLENIIDRISPTRPKTTKLEIRKFYKNYKLKDKLSFDESFASYANKFDGVIIGGGGFLDYWVPDSSTGTTIDISQDTLKSIKCPLLIASVGALPHQVIPQGNLRRFKEFLEFTAQRDNISIALRNDGSRANLREEFGDTHARDVYEILDNGFFYAPPQEPYLLEKDYIAINLAPDQLEMLSKERKKTDTTEFYVQIKKIIEHCINELKLHVVLVPHIQNDLSAILQAVQSLDSFTARSNISIAPCIQGDNGANKIFSIYKNSRATIATRFHGNVCSIAMQKPCIGISALDRVGLMYDSIGMKESYAYPNKNLSRNVIERLTKIIDLPHIVEKTAQQKALEAQSLDFYKRKLTPVLN